MALVHQATCPTCGQVHMVTGMRSVYAGPAVEVCGECLVREAEEAAERGKDAAFQAVVARCGRLPVSMQQNILDTAKFKVLLRLVCAGRTDFETLRNIERFWNEVRKEVES